MGWLYIYVEYLMVLPRLWGFYLFDGMQIQTGKPGQQHAGYAYYSGHRLTYCYYFIGGNLSLKAGYLSGQDIVACSCCRRGKACEDRDEREDESQEFGPCYLAGN